MKRNASAHWAGSGKEGKGSLTTQSTTLNQTQYSYSSRFEEGIGTNPEELIGAAHAGCFSMKLSFIIGAAGFTPETIDTKAIVNLENGSIDKIHLEVSAKIPGANAEQFQTWAADAKANCPVSKLFNAEISMEAHLI
jgi:osmotically inducible protein OsmC